MIDATSSLVARPTSSERFAATIAHGGTLIAWFFAPLLIFVLKRTDSRYVAFQSLQALLWSAAGTLVSLATCGLAIPVFLVWHLVAAVKVADGQVYEYPVIGELTHKLLAA